MSGSHGKPADPRLTVPDVDYAYPGHHHRYCQSRGLAETRAHCPVDVQSVPGMAQEGVSQVHYQRFHSQGYDPPAAEHVCILPFR